MHAAARPPRRAVELSIDPPGDFYYIVTGAEGGRFVARRFRKGEGRKEYHENFSSPGGLAMVFGRDAMVG